MALPTAPSNPSHRQKRELDLYNAGSQTIPPNAVVEIVDASRPEFGSPLTPEGGPTIFHVQRPTKDNICACLINGPLEIPPGQWGRIGWNDYPALALLESLPSSVPQTYGVKENHFGLWPNHCGFIVVGDTDPITMTAQVVRWDDCGDIFPVSVDECFYPGTLAQTAHKMQWDCEQGYVRTGATVCVDDPLCYVMALPWSVSEKEVFWVKGQACDSGSQSGECCCTPIARFGTTRWVKVEEMIASKSSGQGKILCDWQCPPQTVTPCAITVCNTSLRKVSCDLIEDERMLAHLTPMSPQGCVWVLDVPRRPEKALVMLAQPMVIGSPNVPVTFIKWIDVADDWQDKPITIKSYTTVGCAGDLAIVIWEEEACDWVAISVAPTLVPKLMTDVSEADCKVRRHIVRHAYVMFGSGGCGDEEIEDAIGLRYEDFVVDASASCSSGGSISITKQRYCVLGKPVGNSWQDAVATFVAIDVPQDILVNESTCGLTMPTARYWVIGCYGSPGTTIVLPGERLDVVTDTWFRQDGLDLKVTDYTTPICVFHAGVQEEGDEDPVFGTDCDTDAVAQASEAWTQPQSQPSQHIQQPVQASGSTQPLTF